MPWRQLGPLAAAVLAVHLALLQGTPPRLAPQAVRPVQFATRSVVPPAPATPAPAAAQPSPAPPSPAAPPGKAAPAPTLLPVRSRASRATPVPAAAPPQAPVPTPAPQEVAPATIPAALVAQAAPRARPLPPPVAHPLPAIALPAPARLHYEVTLQKGPLSLSGSATLDWRHDGKQYEAQLEAHGVVGSRVQRSTGRITPEGLAPTYFSDKARGEQATHFDRANGRLVFSNNRPEAALESGMQDRLSVILQLAALVAGDPAKYPAGTQVAIPTASTREADTWVFAVEGEEDLALPGGSVPALKLQRLPRREYDQKVELWLAPRMDYAPVRLRLTNPNGDTVDNRWSSTDRG